MPIETKATNTELRKLISFLWKTKRPIWRAVAEQLAKPRRLRAEVNISKINRYTSEGDTVVVPGKVLGCGELDHPVTVAAFAFSKNALEKIKAAGGRAVTIWQLVEENPKGSNVKIMR
ncbi:MAG TPA: 50S ribosomal protein L18e [Candidatus Bathyarchaeota archaeon]|nr:50S ribosomal protein L18e [Candidatus Bathyarchaeota archaeon]